MRIQLFQYIPTEQIPRIDPAVLAPADHGRVGESESRANSVSFVGMVFKGLQELAVGFVHEADGGVER